MLCPVTGRGWLERPISRPLAPSPPSPPAPCKPSPPPPPLRQANHPSIPPVSRDLSFTSATSLALSHLSCVGSWWRAEPRSSCMALLIHKKKRNPGPWTRAQLVGCCHTHSSGFQVRAAPGLPRHPSVLQSYPPCAVWPPRSGRRSASASSASSESSRSGVADQVPTCRCQLTPPSVLGSSVPLVLAHFIPLPAICFFHPSLAYWPAVVDLPSQLSQRTSPGPPCTDSLTGTSTAGHLKRLHFHTAEQHPIFLYAKTNAANERCLALRCSRNRWPRPVAPRSPPKLQQGLHQ